MKLSDLLEEREVMLIGKRISIASDNIVFTVEMTGKPWKNDFNCCGYELTTLKGAPSSTGYFNCSYNNLTSLEGAPSSVSGYFNCSDNKLTSLVGASSSVGGNFFCFNNKLTSLHDVHKIIKKMNGALWAENNPIASCVLGVLLIDGCTKLKIDNEHVQNIINKYLPNTRGFSAVIECQSELLDAGLDEYAKL